jgi:hypothetical protein
VHSISPTSSTDHQRLGRGKPDRDLQGSTFTIALGHTDAIGLFLCICICICSCICLCFLLFFSCVCLSILTFSTSSLIYTLSVSVSTCIFSLSLYLHLWLLCLFLIFHLILVRLLAYRIVCIYLFIFVARDVVEPSTQAHHCVCKQQQQLRQGWFSCE